MQVCTSLQTDNHASTPPLSFLQARCPSCCPTNRVKALKAKNVDGHETYFNAWQEKKLLNRKQKKLEIRKYTQTHTHPFNGPFSKTTRVRLRWEVFADKH